LAPIHSTEETMMRLALAFASVVVLAALASPSSAQRWGGYDDGHRGSSSSGAPRGNYAPRGVWAVGTYYGANGANGERETITIQPDGTVELRAQGKAPVYGTFAGETLTVGSRISKVEPARGGIVIDGSYYRR
jgi:hypothetical protein